MSKTTSMAQETNDLRLTEARKLIGLEAAWELDALARLLPDLVPNIDEVRGSHHAVRGIAGRMLRLTSALMSVLGNDHLETDAALRRIVFLEGQG